MKTAVITGASSGIGEITALTFARQGVNVVLAARRYNLLQAIAIECEKFGVKALVVKTDVSKKEEIERLAAKAIQNFGSFDYWINNASSIMYGRFLDISSDEFRQMVETNLYGYIYGAREALTQFKAQGHGTLINVASGYGAIPAPFVSPYVTTKFAVRGFAASLRQELIADGIKNINVCTVLPATINTPVYQNSANKTGRKVVAIPPVYKPQIVADAIYNLTINPKAEVVAGKIIKLPIALYNIFPGAVGAAMAKYVNKFGYKNNQKAPISSGNLYQPTNHKGITGGWQSKSLKMSKYILPILTTLGVIWVVQSHKRQDKL